MWYIDHIIKMIEKHTGTLGIVIDNTKMPAPPCVRSCLFHLMANFENLIEKNSKVR